MLLQIALEVSLPDKSRELFLCPKSQSHFQVSSMGPKEYDQKLS